MNDGYRSNGYGGDTLRLMPTYALPGTPMLMAVLLQLAQALIFPTGQDYLASKAGAIVARRNISPQSRLPLRIADSIRGPRQPNRAPPGPHVMKRRHFPYRLDKRWSALFLALGVDDDDGVDITGAGELIATYGRFSVKTTLGNVDHTVVTGPHRWYTAVGLRLSFTDDGLTFGTNHHKGLSIAFVERIPKVVGFKDHSTLWVSVADPEGLAAAIGK